MFVLEYRGKTIHSKNILSKEYLDIVMSGANATRLNTLADFQYCQLRAYTGGGSSFYDVFASHPGWAENTDFNDPDTFTSCQILRPSGFTDVLRSTTARVVADKDTTIDGVFIYAEEVRAIFPDIGFGNKYNILIASSQLDEPLEIFAGEQVSLNFVLTSSVSL